MNTNETILKMIKDFGEQEVKYRTDNYKGKGRPRKSDYIMIKRKDLRDYQCLEMLQHGFATAMIDYKSLPVCSNN